MLQFICIQNWCRDRWPGVGPHLCQLRSHTVWHHAIIARLDTHLCNHYHLQSSTQNMKSSENLKVRYRQFIQHRLAYFSRTCDRLYYLGSVSWLAWANDTAAHYAAIHYPHQWTTGPVVQQANIPPPQSATLGLHPVARKLLLISHPAEGRGLSWPEYTVG